jgi:hypothetical protein
LQYAREEPGNLFSGVSCSFEFKAKTDNQGHFTFDMAPPGNLIIMTETIFTDPSGLSTASDLPLAPVTVNASETATITADMARFATELQGLNAAGK